MSNFKAVRKISGANINREDSIEKGLKAQGILFRSEENWTDIMSGMGGKYLIEQFFYSIEGEERTAWEISGASCFTSITYKLEDSPSYFEAKALLSYLQKVGAYENRDRVSPEQLMKSMGL